MTRRRRAIYEGGGHFIITSPAGALVHRGNGPRMPHLARLAPGEVAEGPPGAAFPASRQSLPGYSGSVRVGQGSPLRLGHDCPQMRTTLTSYAVAGRAADSESPLRYTRCCSPMRVLAVNADPQQVLRILHHLIKTGAAFPGAGRSFSKLTRLPPRSHTREILAFPRAV
jgi:hypothetical protein